MVDDPNLPKAKVLSSSVLRLTLPFVQTVLWARRKAIVVLFITSIALGVVPTIKSEIEAGAVDEINTSIKLTPQPHFVAALGRQIERFRLNGAIEQGAGVTERLVRRSLRGASLWLGLLGYLAIGAAGFGMEFLARRASAGLGAEIFRSLRLQGMVRGLEAEPQSTASAPNTPAQFAAAIQQGASNTSQMYRFLLEAAQDAISVITVIVLLASRSVWFSLGCGLLVAGQVTISVVQARNLKGARLDLDKKRNDLAARTDDILSKKEIILAWEQQHRYAEKLDGYATKYADVERTLTVRETVYGSLASLLTDYGRIGVLLLSLLVALTLSQHAVSSLGDVYFLISLYVRLLNPVSNLLDRYDEVRRSEATSWTYLRLLALPAPPQPSASVLTQQRANGLEVELEKITYLYGAEEHSRGLRDCSFHIPPGSVTLLLGPSGCGKTTAARLLLGFMKPLSGRMLLDGADTAGMSGVDQRLLMSYVSQGDYIVDDTVRENLSWNPANLDDAELCKALFALRITSVAEAQALLGERASSLSIGQQQRLSLCRVLLDTAPFLILDEPLTGVDLFTMRDVLPPLIKSITDTRRTVLLISHRVAFVTHADHVIIMDNDGDVVEQGQPIELLANTASKLSTLYRTALTELGALTPTAP